MTSAGSAADSPREVTTSEAQTTMGTTRGTSWRTRHLRDGSTLRWWRELLMIGAVYIVYESVRNVSKSGATEAYANALRIIDWQRATNLWHELAVQEWALRYEPLIVASNYYYGVAYMAVTIFGLLWLYRRHPDDYPLWRNTLLIGTLLGLIGFATFPLMPPRLLDRLGDGQFFGFVDTLVSYPTLWSFESPTMQAISNQFAAMPSLHCGWAFWGMWVFLPRVTSWWAKTLAVLYPATTVFVVVATGNHYVLDAVGGLVIFTIGYGAARVITRAGRQAAPVTAPVGPASP